MHRKIFLVLVALVIAACGDDGDDDQTSGGARPEVTVDEVAIPAVEVEPIRLRFVLTDLDGNAVNASGGATIVSDSGGLINGSAYAVNAGELRIEAQSTLPDQDNNGLPDTFAEVRVRFSGLGDYLDSAADFTVSRFGENVFEVPLMPLVNSESFTVEQKTVTMKDEPPADPPSADEAESDAPAITTVAFSARGGSREAPRATAYVPRELLAYDEQGGEIDTEELTVVVAAIAPEKAVAAGALPASGVAGISNPDRIEEDAVLGMDIPDGSRVRLTPLASTRVSAMTASGARVSRMNPATKIKVVIDLPLGAVNPVTSEVVREGDLVPVFSQSDDGGLLFYEGLHAVERDGNRLFVMVETSHLSYFNVSFAEVVDGCSGRIYVEDVNGEPFPHTGVFKLENDRIFDEEAYRGSEDGQIIYEDLPNAPTSIVFVSDDGEPVSLVPETTTIGLTSEGEVNPAMATGVDLCANQGTTITLKDDTPSGPVLVVDYKSGWRRDNTIQAGGLREGDEPEEAATMAIPVVLLNPEDEPVNVTYDLDGSGASPVSVGDDIAGPDSGVLTLTAADPAGEIVVRTLPDTHIEDRVQEFQLTIGNQDGVPFSNGDSQIHVRGRLYDDDEPEIVDITVNDVTEGEDLTVTVTLDRPVAEGGRYVMLQVSPTDEPGVGAAWPGVDVVWQSNHYARFSEGELTADVVIPTIDNTVVDGSRSLTLRPSTARDIYIPESDLTRHATILDDDSAPGTAPATFTLSAIDRNALPFTGVTLDEGEDIVWFITLDAPAQEEMDLQVNLDQPDNSNTSWIVVEGAQSRPVQSVDTLTIPQGQSRLALFMYSGYDGRVLGDYESGVLTVDSPDLGDEDQAPSMLIRDVDLTEIDIWTWLSPNKEAFIEGEDRSFSMAIQYSSNDPATSIDFAPLSVRVDPTYPAEPDVDYTLAQTSIGRFEGESGYRTLDVDILDDDVGEYSETLRLDAVVTSLGPVSDEAWRVPYIGEVFTSAATITDDDRLVLALRDTRFEFQSNGAFEGEVNAKVTLTIPMEEDLSFEVTLVDTDGLVMNQDTATVTIEAGETTGNAAFRLLSTTPGDLDLNHAERNTSRKITASVRMTEESRQRLEEKNIEWLISKADAGILLDFDYVGTPPATGGTGGTGF